MSSGTIPGNTARAVPPSPAATEARQLIDRQIQRARRQLQWIDFATALLSLFAGIALYLLLIALIDHWVFELGAKSRWLALLLLVFATVAYAARTLAPLVLRRINPTYAAWLLERHEPTLKNSLVNFLLLRADRRQVPDAVFQAIEQRAAADVAQLPIEATLDHTCPLRWGYILAGVLALCAAYLMLSPKNPWTSVQRVLAPWSAIARPSRVQIEEIQPGNSDVYQGQAAVVSARIRGLGSDQTAYVVYSTADGQIIDRRVPLGTSAGLVRVEASIPPDEGGLQQDLRYRIVAGDAQSDTFELKLKAAPLVTVSRVELEFPAYLKRPRQVITGTGDIRAPEGTRATIHVKANLPIKSAWIEFDPDGPPGTTTNLHFPIDAASAVSAANGANANSAVDGSASTADSSGPREARQSFTLQWLPDRQQPKHRSYQVRFKAVDDQLSTLPIVHRIEVIPDLAPEVEFLVPSGGQAEVPADGSQPIEVRAVDPDYGLVRLTLRGAVNGNSLFQIPLLDATSGANRGGRAVGGEKTAEGGTAADGGAPDGVTGQSVQSLMFRPADWKLQPGTRVVVVAVAEDNKAIPSQGVAQPNSRQSRELILQITEPTGQKPPEKPTDKPSQKPESGKPETGKPESGKPESGKPESGKPESGKPDSGKPDSGKPDSGKPDSGKPDSGKPDSGKPDSGKPDSGKPDSGKPDSGKPDSGKPDSGKPDSGKPDSGTGKPQAGGSEDPNSDEKPTDDNPANGNGGKPRDQGTGKPQPGGNQNQNHGDSQGNPGGNQGSPGSTKPAQGTPTAGDDAGAREEPLHDGEVFDQTLKYLREQRGAKADTARDLAKSNASSASKPDRNSSTPAKPGTTPERPLDGNNAKSGKSGEGAVNAARTEPATEPTTDQPNSNKPVPNKPPTDKPLDGSPPSDQPRGDKPAVQGSGNPPSGKPDRGAAANDEPQLPGGNKPPGDLSDNPGKAFNPDAKRGDQLPEDPERPRGGITPPQKSPEPYDGAQTPEAEAANLDYSRRATELVLEYLKDQKDKPDRELLDRLGWTPDELARFVDRWEKMKQTGRDEHRDGKRELDQTLKSLGLRPAADKRRAVESTSDGQRGNRDAGARSEPPAKYRDRFEAYRQGTSRSKKP